MPDLDLNDPETAPVRADLARLYIVHKADLALTGWSDERIVAEVNTITIALIAAGTQATAHGNTAWLDRYRWFSEAFQRQLDNGRAVRLDG